MEEHPIASLMSTAMESLQSVVETNTIIGDPMETPDGSVIIPISKVGIGFAAGGSEFKSQSSDNDETLPFGGGSGGGVSLTPVAFLVIKKDEMKLIRLDQENDLQEKLLEMTPKWMDKVEKMMKKNRGKREKGSSEDKTHPLHFDI